FIKAIKSLHEIDSPLFLSVFPLHHTRPVIVRWQSPRNVLSGVRTSNSIPDDFTSMLTLKDLIETCIRVSLRVVRSIVRRQSRLVGVLSGTSDLSDCGVRGLTPRLTRRRPRTFGLSIRPNRRSG